MFKKKTNCLSDVFNYIGCISKISPYMIKTVKKTITDTVKIITTIS